MRTCDLFAHTSRLPGKSPLQRHIVAVLRARGEMSERGIQGWLFRSLAPTDRPRITAALGALMRGHIIERVGSTTHPRYFTRA